MHCEHCCFSCTEQGTDMSLEVFKKTCELAYNYGMNIFLGGGEPTLHPLFEHFLGIAILNNSDDIKVGVITNGTNKELTKKLLYAAKRDDIFCELSLDDYHDIDMVDQSVIDLAQRFKMTRSIVRPMKRGRSLTGEDGCACNELFVTPNGNIYPCGCQITKLGNILDNNLNPCQFVYNGECEHNAS